MSKTLVIDADLMAASREYVLKQLDTFARYESYPANWSDEKTEELATKVAQFPQKLRNMRATPA